MEEGSSVKAVLKWAGIIALVAVPIAILLKKRKPEPVVPLPDEGDADSYVGELRD